MYNNFDELLELATIRNVSLSQIILEAEMKLSDLSESQIYEKLELNYNVMLESTRKALHTPLVTPGALIQGISMDQYNYSKGENSICGSFINSVMARALSCSETNASMGRVCAAPTAGACGIVPAVVSSLSDKYNSSKKEVLDALLTASGVGAVIMQNATVSGAEGACQAETGVGATMATAAAVQLAGGTPDMAINACCFVLMNVLGLVCDPVAGLVQVPCAQRNAIQSINAMLCADLAMAGMKSVVPLDQMVDAMHKVGKALPPSLKETSIGGMAGTEAAKEISRRIFG
ncbi:MAG: sdaAA [Clostridiales bacterium]|jgi:L-serine dehydratase|nr:sdaAA [Clostridiales bacterium]